MKVIGWPVMLYEFNRLAHTDNYLIVNYLKAMESHKWRNSYTFNITKKKKCHNLYCLWKHLTTINV